MKLYNFTRLLFFCLILCWLHTGLAQRSTARFLLWRPSAASMAMGGTGVAYHNPGFESYYNPALLVHLPAYSLTGAYFKPYPFFQNMVRAWSSVNFAIQGIGFFSISNNMYWKARPAFTNASGYFLIPADDDDISDYLFSWQAKLSYALAIKPDLFIGIGVAYLDYNIFEMSGSGVGAENREGKTGGISVDLGVHYLLWDQPALIKLNNIEIPEAISSLSRRDRNYGITVGAALLNIGSNLSFVDDAQSDPLPSMLLVGFSLPVLTSNYLEFDIIIDLEQQVYEKSILDFWRSGAVLTLYNLVQLKAGYVNDINGPENSYETWGIGILTRYINFQFARYESTFLPTWHYDMTLFVEF